MLAIQADRLKCLGVNTVASGFIQMKCFNFILKHLLVTHGKSLKVCVSKLSLFSKTPISVRNDHLHASNLEGT